MTQSTTGLVYSVHIDHQQYSNLYLQLARDWPKYSLPQVEAEYSCVFSHERKDINQSISGATIDFYNSKSLIRFLLRYGEYIEHYNVVLD